MKATETSEAIQKYPPCGADRFAILLATVGERGTW
jgi:hypothetical protein